MSLDDFNLPDLGDNTGFPPSPFELPPERWDQDTRDTASLGMLHTLVDRHVHDTGQLPTADTMSLFRQQIQNIWDQLPAPETDHTVAGNATLDKNSPSTGHHAAIATIVENTGDDITPSRDESDSSRLGIIFPYPPIRHGGQGGTKNHNKNYELTFSNKRLNR